MDGDRSEDAPPGTSGDRLPTEVETEIMRRITRASALEVQESQAANEWKGNAYLLYDSFISVDMKMCPHCVTWLPFPEEDDYPRIAFGTNNPDGVNEVVVLEMRLAKTEHLSGTVTEDWKEFANFETREGDENLKIEGFGLEPVHPETAPFKVCARFPHETEVNRILPCPVKPELLATRTANGAVFLWDWKRQADNAPYPEERPFRTVKLSPPGAQQDDIYALAWSSPPEASPRGSHAHFRNAFLASGTEDGRCCIWDVNVIDIQESTQNLLHCFDAHEGVLGGVVFKPSQPDLLATVGDDGCLKLWDLRTLGIDRHGRPIDTVRASVREVHTVDWSAPNEHHLATAGNGYVVSVWDRRNLRVPFRELSEAHTGDVQVVKFATFDRDILASCSKDSRVHIWDLKKNVSKARAKDREALRREARESEREDDQESEAGQPELVFSHLGHKQRVDDFDWGPESMLMCSVGLDYQLQIWQPNNDIDFAMPGGSPETDPGDVESPSDMASPSGAAGSTEAVPSPKRMRVTQEDS